MEPCRLWQEEKPCSNRHPAHRLQPSHRWDRECASVPGKRDTHLCAKEKKSSQLSVSSLSCHIFSLLCILSVCSSLWPPVIMDGWFALFSSHDPPLKGSSLRTQPLWAGHAGREGQGGPELPPGCDFRWRQLSYLWEDGLRGEKSIEWHARGNCGLETHS